MMASMSLKDVGEIEHKHAKPIDILHAHSVGSARGVDLFASLMAYEKEMLTTGGKSVMGSLPADSLCLRSVRSMPSKRRPMTTGRRKRGGF